MSNFKFFMLMLYNMVVVVATVASIYYISGWMFCLIFALMKNTDDDVLGPL